MNKELETQKILKYRSVWMGLAILWVMLFHSGLRFSGSIPDVLNMIVVKAKTFGYGGVDIFMFASGIGCFYSLSADNDIIEFIKRRAVRILPTYEIFILVWIIAHEILGSMPFPAVIGNIFCVQNFTGNSNDFNWYVSAMWLMYFSAPFFFGFIDREGRRRIELAALLCALLLVSFAFWNSKVFIITVSRVPLFYMGMLFAKDTRKRNITAGKVCFLTVLMVLGIAAELLCHRFLNAYLWNYGLWWYPFILITPGLCVLISLLSDLLCRTKAGKFAVGLLGKIGEHSFEIYLIHIFLFECITDLVEKGYLPGRSLVWLISFAAVLILAAAFKWFVTRLSKKFCR